jgi:hypothetical protein
LLAANWLLAQADGGVKKRILKVGTGYLKPEAGDEVSGEPASPIQQSIRDANSFVTRSLV